MKKITIKMHTDVNLLCVLFGLSFRMSFQPVSYLVICCCSLIIFRPERADRHHHALMPTFKRPRSECSGVCCALHIRLCLCFRCVSVSVCLCPLCCVWWYCVCGQPNALTRRHTESHKEDMDNFAISFHLADEHFRCVQCQRPPSQRVGNLQQCAIFWQIRMSWQGCVSVADCPKEARSCVAACFARLQHEIKEGMHRW